MTTYPREMLKAGAAVICRCEGPQGIAMTHSEITAAVLDATLGLSQAELDVIAERRRQVAEEGFTAEHDDRYPDGLLERHAACYAWAASLSDEFRKTFDAPSLMGAGAPATDRDTRIWFNSDIIRLLWTWARAWWKPTTRRQDLIKSAAISLAAIERIDRAAAKVAAATPEPTP